MRKKPMYAILLILLVLSSMTVGAVNSEPLSKGPMQILNHDRLDSLRFEPVTAVAVPNGEEVSSAPSTAAVMSFQAFGNLIELTLERNDRLIVNLPKDQKDELQRSNIELYRGRISGQPDSWARITKIGEHFSGMIFDGTDVLLLDPSDDVSAALSIAADPGAFQHIIYHLSDVLLPSGGCAVDPSAQPLNDYGDLVNHLRGMFARDLAAANAELDLAVVADEQFVQSNSNPSAAVLARMNVVDGIYSEQVGVQLNIVEIKILSENGPLTATDSSSLLRQFSSYSASPALNNPGLAHLFTGRDLNGNIIGIAYIAALCSDRFGVGLSQTIGTGTAGALTVAHEIGHNFGAPHDNQRGSACAGSPGTFLMNPFINGSDQFSDCSLEQMGPNVANAACITPISIEPTADVRPVLPASSVNAVVGEVFDFVVEVRNSGTVTASNATALVTLSTSISLVDVSVDNGQCTDEDVGEVSCTFGSIVPDGDRTITLSLQATEAGEFVGAVTVEADNDADPNNNRLDASFNIEPVADTPTADVAVVLPTEPVSGVIDRDIPLNIAISNDGPAAATTVRATIDIPPGLALQRSAVNAGSCVDDDGGRITCELEDLPSGSNSRIELVLQGDEPGEFVLDIEASADNDLNIENNIGQVTIKVGDSEDVIFESHFNRGTDGFSYFDDAFGTSQPRYARGYYSRWRASGGGGGLMVQLGGRNNADILGMSGGWKRSFALAETRQVVLTMRFRLTQRSGYEADEFSTALLSVDGNLVVQSGDEFLAKIAGDGNGGGNRTTGWITVVLDLGVLSAGDHTVMI
ncbi:MAG: M12 family metallo-peptidase, partial [Thiohalocapsa sp.]